MNPLALARGIDAWLASRPWRIFLFCLPVLLAGVMLVAIVVAVIFNLQGGGSYDRDVRRIQWLLQSKKYEAARVASLHGLAAAKGEREQAQQLFYLALSLGGLGNNLDAQQLLAAAAPLDHPGFPEAHLLVAQRLLSSTNLSRLSNQDLRNFSLAVTNAASATNATIQTLLLAERHLMSVLAADSNSVAGNELLGRFYINTHNPAKARACLMKIYSAKPEVALLLAITRVQENDSANAILWADRALSAYEKKLIDTAPRYDPADRQGLVQALGIKQLYAPHLASMQPEPTVPAGTNTVPQDSPRFWLGMVRLLLSNGKFGPAVQTLEQQMLVNSNAMYASALGGICAAWVKQIPPDKKEAVAERLQLIQKGLDYAPDNLDLQLLLVQATHGKTEAAAAQTLLNQQLKAATGNTAAWWQFVLWTDNRISGDLVSARQHLQMAYQLAPQIPQIKNDLAMDLSTGTPADQARALQLIQSVLEKYPYEPGFRDTRGFVLARMGRNQEALTDLQFAAPRLANDPDTQKLLASVCAALGMAAPASQVSSSKQMGQVVTLMNEGEYASAVKILEQELQVDSNSAYASTLADVCAAWADQLPMDQLAQRLQIIHKGLQAVPQNQKLQSLLLQTARAAGPVGAAAKKMLEQLVAKSTGEAAAQWHFFLGQDARQRGDLVVARRELFAAYQLTPQAPQIQASLASLLSAGNPADLNQGMGLIQPLADQFPDNPEFRDTRGRILARLGRNQDAVADLEFAAAHLENAASTRLLLAQVYDALGKTKQAEQLRRQSQFKP